MAIHLPILWFTAGYVGRFNAITCAVFFIFVIPRPKRSKKKIYIRKPIKIFSGTFFLEFFEFRVPRNSGLRTAYVSELGTQHSKRSKKKICIRKPIKIFSGKFFSEFSEFRVPSSGTYAVPSAEFLGTRNSKNSEKNSLENIFIGLL